VIVYIDDILIYSEDEESHIRLVEKVPQKLKDNHLCASIKKSVFHASEIKYLGYHISKLGIAMSPEKVQTIRNWAPPRSVKHVQQFLGFANFYRCFIEGFSKVARPLTELTKKNKNAKKNASFVWTEECQQAFDRVKALFTEAPILVHFHPEKPTVVETDASDFALGAIMSQMQPESSRLHPVAYYSRKFKPAKVNYDIHNKEMLAIVAAFKEWEHMLKSVADQITVYTDHTNREYFATTKVLTRRQARWAEHLAEFNFRVIYRPGDKNTKADVLSRRWDHAPKEGGEAEEVSFFKPGQYVGKETLTLRGLGERRASSVEASARVQDPEVRKGAKGPEVQGTQYVAEILTLGAKGMPTLTLGACHGYARTCLERTRSRGTSENW
jgi:hypothetical protein